MARIMRGQSNFSRGQQEIPAEGIGKVTLTPHQPNCAFFRAERFREAEPGHIREQDKEAAAAAIDAAIRAARKKNKKR
jgi:hypothetical protein